MAKTELISPDYVAGEVGKRESHKNMRLCPQLIIKNRYRKVREKGESTFHEFHLEYS